MMKMKEKQIKVGDEVRYGFSLLIVDEIDGETFWCIDEDGLHLGLTIDQIDQY
jgi:hypothetical protein